ncbi:hypothetical protein P278_15710 [Zhouia amylolytica AD3]|uniref:Uncharacterized protein n=1 Tax=Zhouia amylolytica AD3 TaxID=1286632 RepID=W2UPJ0_9FLAO|nr:hypothetical protein P278_15710 [Zhouia amylolytica AD3]
MNYLNKTHVYCEIERFIANNFTYKKILIFNKISAMLW